MNPFLAVLAGNSLILMQNSIFDVQMKQIIKGQKIKSGQNTNRLDFRNMDWWWLGVALLQVSSELLSFPLSPKLIINILFRGQFFNLLLGG